MAINISKLRLTYIIFCIFIFFAFISFTNAIDNPFIVLITRLLYICITLILILNFKSLLTIKSRFAFSLLMLFFYSFFYIIKSIYHDTNIIGESVTGLFYFITYYLIILVVSKFPSDKVIIPFLISSFIIVALSSLVYFGIEIPVYNNGELSDETVDFLGIDIFTGVFINQNAFALFLLIHIILSVIYIQDNNSKYFFKYVIISSIVLSIFFLILTMSRSAILALVIMAILYQIKVVKTKKGLILLVLSTILFVLGSYFLNEYIELIRARTQQAGSSGRLEIWTDALNQFRRNYLLGVGNYTYKDFGNTQLSAHNLYIQKLVSDGILAFTFLFIFLLQALWNAITTLFSKLTTQRDYYKNLLSVSLIAILLHQNFEASLMSAFQPLTLLLFLLIANILNLKSKA